jgi:ribulose-5-phosphate 4-epimerase/fuculose-1-phosphate aldolase
MGLPAMSEARMREEICRLGASLHQRGLTAGSSGNISARTEDGWLLTPTNTSLGSLDPASISKLDWSGRLLDGDPPSKEAFLHRAFARHTFSCGILHVGAGPSRLHSTPDTVFRDESRPASAGALS